MIKNFLCKWDRLRINLTLLLMASGLILGAQTATMESTPSLVHATPQEVGMSIDRLGRVEEMCKKAVADNEIPGIVALIARHGKIVFHRAFGHSDAKGTLLDKQSIFRIASQSKAITATAVMMLWEEGKFQLDDPISKYIPEFQNPGVLHSFKYRDTSYTTVAANQEITIRHLLTHTSGLGYGVIDGDERFQMIYHKAGITDLFTTAPITIKANVKKLAKLPLHHHPGEAYTYSEGLDVLGYFIEIVSGMSFDNFLRTRIFEPLGMKDTWFYLPNHLAKRLVDIQYLEAGKWNSYPATFYDPNYPISGARTFFSGGAGLCSTAKDYAIFLQMYLNGGAYNGTRILSRTTIRSMMGNQTGNLWGNGRYYGLAFGVLDQSGQDQGGRGSVGTFDWGGYFNTQYFADPEEGIVGIIMKQTRGPVPDQTGWKFRQLVFQAIDD